MFNNKFTKNAIESINFANKTCIKLKTNILTLEHLFIGILGVKEGIGSQILSKLGLDPDATIQSIEEELLGPKGTSSSHKDKEGALPDFTNIQLSSEIKQVFDKAFEIAINSGHNYVGSEHLLLGLLQIHSHPFIKELNNLGIDFEKIKKELESYVQYPDLNADMQKMSQVQNPVPPQSPFPAQNKNVSFFETVGRNLTNEARQGKLDPVIGRDDEINRVMQILSRRTKNNPILLGDAGVGKTAIVEGLAQKIANGDVSPVLSMFEIWSIDTASIVAGSQLRGDIEQKILDMIQYIEQKGNIILFIDEIHTIMGAGATSNSSLDIGNILKPALARGILHCIGATTIDEYKEHFDEDPALQRRFQPVDVKELSEEDSLQVLKQVKPIYETFHGVKILDKALHAAVKLSTRYITDRYLPDKAIDIIDEASAKSKLERIQITPAFKNELEKLKDIVNRKNEALRKKNMELASNFLDQEKQIVDGLGGLEKDMKKSWSRSLPKITEKEIKKVISEWTKIPMNSMDDESNQSIKKLQKDLTTNIIGQNYASQSIINSIKRAKAGLSGFDRPLASFLFVGPTGVGKTELAKQLANSLFGTKDALIQVDMSELMEGHSISKLIGSPPGYVGYDKGGQLTDKVRRHPFSVILFDEIEKASPDVLNILLQILDEGRLTDSKGRMINFKNTVIIMTSNIGADLLRKDTTVGLYLGSSQSDDENPIDPKVVETQEKIIEELKEYLDPEFINRIDDVIVFRELTREDIYKITKLHINKFIQRLKKENNIVLKNLEEDEIAQYITEMGYSEEYGAREINRVIKSTLENIVAEKILEQKWDADSRKALHLNLKLEDNKLKVESI